MPDKQPKLRLVTNPKPGSQASAEAAASGRRAVQVDWSIMMAHAQDGDATAYRTLLHAITPHIRTLARRHLHNASDAEDAVQDVLIAIHMLRATYDPRRPFGPWLKTIASRKIIDRLRLVSRHNRREAYFSDDLLNLAQPTATEDRPLEPMAQADLLNHLPAREAQAIRLTKFEGLSLEAASAASGQSISALKVATHRALKRLKSLLGKDRQA